MTLFKYNTNAAVKQLTKLSVVALRLCNLIYRRYKENDLSTCKI